MRADNGLQMRPELWDALPEIWEDVLSTWGRGSFVVYTGDEDESLYGFGMSVFVADPFLEEERRRPQPYIAARFYEDHRNVVLGIDEVREANTEGRLNVLVLHACQKFPDLAREETRRVMPIAAQSFLFAHAGYSIRNITGEVYGADFAAFLRAGGYELVADFPEQAKHPRRPHLLELDRDRVPRGGSDLAMQLFYPEKPIFFFTLAEQRLLAYALTGLTDQKLGTELDVSLETVRSTWDSIYTRVGRVRPRLLHGADGEAVNVARGAEKRRQLLDYLRQHMEELRPVHRP